MTTQTQVEDDGGTAQHVASSDHRETDLARLVRLLRMQWLTLAVSTGVFLALAIVYVLVATPVYRSAVLFAPTEQDQDVGGLASLAGSFGGLASLAGVSLGGGAQKDQAIAVLKSRRFTETFIEANDLLPILFADKWDATTERWRADLEASEVPTMSDAYRRFDQEVRQVSEDKATGLIQLSIVWEDRELAANWANEIISQLNEFLRQLAIAESEANISYLRAELEASNLVQVRQAIFGLIEQQVEIAMIANTRKEFAFKVLDPATAADPDDTYWPMPAAIVVLAIVFGFAIGVFLVLLRNALKPQLD